MERKVIDMKNITKVYRIGDIKVNALRGADLTIREGEFAAEILSNVVDEQFYISSRKPLCSHLLNQFTINKLLVFKHKQYQLMTF